MNKKIFISLLFSALTASCSSNSCHQASWIVVSCRRRSATVRTELFGLSPFNLDDSSLIADCDDFNIIFDEILKADKIVLSNDVEISEYYRRDPADFDSGTPIRDKDGLSRLLQERYSTRQQGDYDKVGEIDILLRKRYGVRAYDNPNFWTTQARPPASHLRRIVRKQDAEMKAKFGPNGHPYVQVGDCVDETICPLTMTEIHSLLSKHQLSIMSGLFEEADAIRFEMLINGIQLDERLMLWRGDGKSKFTESVGGKSDDSGALELPKSVGLAEVIPSETIVHGSLRRIEQLLEKRAEARYRGEDYISRFLSFELFKTYKVELNDESKTWRILKAGETSSFQQDLPNGNVSLCFTKNLFPPLIYANEERKYSSPSYRRSMHSRSVANDLMLQRINHLLQERIHKREESKFLEADALRKELWESYHVGVNDRLRQWSVAGVLDSSGSSHLHGTDSK